MAVQTSPTHLSLVEHIVEGAMEVLEEEEELRIEVERSLSYWTC
jgi:hypothetical protein